MKNNTIDTSEYIELATSYIDQYEPILEKLLTGDHALRILSQEVVDLGFAVLNESVYVKNVLKADFLKKNQVEYYETQDQKQKILRISENSTDSQLNNDTYKKWHFKSATYTIKNNDAEINSICFIKHNKIKENSLITELKINPVKNSAHFVLTALNKRKKHNVFLFSENMPKYEFLDSNHELLNNMNHSLKSVVQSEINGLIFLLSQENEEINKSILECCFYNKPIQISQDLKEQYQLLYDNMLSVKPILFSAKIDKKESLQVVNKIKI